MSITAEIKKIIDPEGKMTQEEYKKEYKKYWNKLNKEKVKQIHPNLKQPDEAPEPKPQPEKKVKPTGLSEPEVTTAVSSGSTTSNKVDDALPPQTKPLTYSEVDKEHKHNIQERDFQPAEDKGYKYKRGPYKRREYDLLGSIYERLYKQTRSHFQGCLPTDDGMKCVEGCAFGKYYYQLIINVESLPGVSQLTLTVYPSKLKKYGNPAIWDAIVNREYAGKQLLFICHIDKGNYRLIDWKEVPK